MDRYLLRYFLAVAELGSFSKAAARVSVTQPTLSVGIAKLEDEVGARLFERTTRRVSLTPAGSKFLQHARRITQEYEAALREVSETPQLKRVRAGILSTIPARDLERVVAQHAKNSGGEALEILDSTERDIANRLSRRTARCGDHDPAAGPGELCAGEAAERTLCVVRRG